MLDMLCKELGVKIGEKWKGNDGRKYYINKNGQLINVQYKFFSHDEYYVEDNIERVLTGELVPEWTPKIGNTCWTIGFKANETIIDWNNSEILLDLFNKGLLFKTKDEAERTAFRILNFIEGASKGQLKY